MLVANIKKRKATKTSEKTRIRHGQVSNLWSLAPKADALPLELSRSGDMINEN